MRSTFLRFTGHQVRVIARDRQLVFWNGVFFVIVLLLFLGPLSGGDQSVQVMLTATIVTIGIMANALFGVAVGLTSARERGVFRRYALTPALGGVPVAATVVARAIVVFAAATVQVLIARIGFGLPWSGGVLSWLVLVAVGTTAFAAAGLVIASLAASTHVANTLANLIFIPMMALSGTALPMTMMPKAWADVHGVLPAATLSEGLLAAFVGGATLIDHLHSLAYLGIWTVGLAAIGTYRWQRRDP